MVGVYVNIQHTSVESHAMSPSAHPSRQPDKPASKAHVTTPTERKQIAKQLHAHGLEPASAQKRFPSASGSLNAVLTNA